MTLVGCARSAGTWLAFVRDHARLRLHDDHQHHRAARRHQDRLVVHRHDHRDVAHLARAALDRAARAGGRSRMTTRAAFHPRGRRRARSGSSPTGRTPGYPRSTSTSCARRSESHHLPPDERVLFLEVRPGDVSEFSGMLKVDGRRRRRAPRAALRQPGDSRTPSPRCCSTSATRPDRSRTPTSAGPKATRSSTC